MAENKGSGSGSIGEQFDQYRQRVMDSEAVRNVMQSETVRMVQERIQAQGPDILERVKSLASEAMVRRISIQQDGRTIFEFPLAVGLGGALIAPQLAALGAVAALVTNCTIAVEREDPSSKSPSASEAHPASTGDTSSTSRSAAATGASSSGGGGYGSSVGGTDQSRTSS